MSRWRNRNPSSPGSCGAVGADQLMADERGEPRQDVGLVGRQRLDGAAMEDLAFDRAALDDRRS